MHLTLNINANYYRRGNGNAKLVPVGANDVWGGPSSRLAIIPARESRLFRRNLEGARSPLIQMQLVVGARVVPRRHARDYYCASGVICI